MNIRNRNKLTDKENKRGCQWGWERINWNFYITYRIDKQGPTVGNCTQYSGINQNGKEY